MIEILKKQWFVVLVACILIIFAVYCIYDTNKGKLPGKSVDGKDLVAALSDAPITADDLYAKLFETNGTTQLVSGFQDLVASKAVETTDDIKSEAKLQAESIEANFKSGDPTNYKTSIQTQLNALGYEDLNDYCLKVTKLNKLQKDYMDENMDSLFTPIYEEKQSRIVAHILIKMEDPASPTDEELAKIKAVEDGLAAGTSFADVAKQYSEDSSATNGGIIGYADSDSGLVTAFKEKALELNKDEVSDWVSVSSDNYKGWHKIKVIETDKDAILADDTAMDGVYLAIKNNNANIGNQIVWEASKKLEITFANDEIKQAVMDKLQITE